MPAAPTAPRTVSIVSVHMDLGAGRRGVDMGPNALRVAGLGGRLTRLGLDVVETGSVRVREPEVCPVCSSTLTPVTRTIAHLGVFSCAHCGWRTPERDVRVAFVQA